VVRGARHDYADQPPSPDNIALVVEVSDATLRRDRTLKLRIYARAGIPVYWIINLPERQIEVYSEPAGEGYARRLIYTDAQDLPVSIGGAVVGHLRAAELLG
jgi:Uma2 family endonuclease